MNKKGFTLVELLAVIAILALLVTTVSIAVVKLYNENVNKTMIVQNNKIKEAASIYLNDQCLLPLADADCPKTYTEGQYICLEDLTVKENYLSEVTYKNDKCSGVIVFEENSDGDKVEPVSYLFCGYNSSKKTYNYATNPLLDLTKYSECNIENNASSGGSTTTTTNKTTTTTTTTTTSSTTTTTTSGTNSTVTTTMKTTTTTKKADTGGAGDVTAPVIPNNCTVKGKNSNYYLAYCVVGTVGTGDSKETTIGTCNKTSYCVYDSSAHAEEFKLYYNNNGTWVSYDLETAVSNNIITVCELVDLGYSIVCKNTAAY